ncbi:MAG: DNA cytosine methyltransferase [Proteobacteria bacterium]|nr:DNA cytosine methyltransferase [Pseudomonadota bacterium]
MAKPKFVSAFSGAGGLDIGFEEGGWQCVYATDHDPEAVQTLRHNAKLSHAHFKRAEIICEDVQQLSGAKILQRTGLKKGNIDALIGGPPCQSWSSAGHQLGLADPRGQLFLEFARLADQLDVRWIVFENVRGLLTARGPEGEPGGALELIRRTLLQKGFQTEANLLNAADFGVAQRRVRLFLIGFRAGDHPTFPIATHTKNVDLVSDGRLPWKTLRECLSEISPLSSDEILRPNPLLKSQLASVPEGSGLKSVGKREATRPGGHWGYKQGAFIADPSLPARTVTANRQQDWIRDPKLGLRRLSPRECAAIQSFPPAWEFLGDDGAKYRQIGNAVPPGLGKAVAASLREHIFRQQAWRLEKQSRHKELLPLQPSLRAAIDYTVREELRNGASRRAAPAKRKARIAK